jgi:hypothetical protein
MKRGLIFQLNGIFLNLSPYEKVDVKRAKCSRFIASHRTVNFNALIPYNYSILSLEIKKNNCVFGENH